MEDRNSFREIMRDRECSVCPDIINEMERHIEKQVKTFSVLSKVVELFVPNALHTAARFIDGDTDALHPRSGDGPSDEPGGRRGMSPTAQAGWRRKPS